MQPIRNAWCVQIDITNYCSRSCLYCSRYNRHLRPNQRKHMTLEQLRTALNSVKTWPTRVGIIGGEPLLHPEFVRICELIQGIFPPGKMALFTSGGRRYAELLPLIQETFDFVAYNEHNEEQQKTCKHQPLTVAIKDAVPDERLREKLIDECWVQRSWCPSINHFGAYFCEVAAAQDVLLNEGKHAWPVVPGWWKRVPGEYQDQIAACCNSCGMPIPMERELILNKKEKFSPSMLERCRNLQLKRVGESDVELFNREFSKDEIASNVPHWTPGNYRGDLQEDQTAPEGRGFIGVLE